MQGFNQKSFYKIVFPYVYYLFVVSFDRLIAQQKSGKSAYWIYRLEFGSPTGN